MAKLEFEKSQDQQHIAELRAAVQQERAQTLNIMEKINEERAEKVELQDEISDLETQLMRHKDEIEELSSLYEAEKLQSLVLEEALQAEKENFNNLTLSLSEERKRSEEAAARDSETILELRTALEIEKEKEARLGVESPHFLGRSNKGSRNSLGGSRQSVNQHEELMQVMSNVLSILFLKTSHVTLTQERSRCDRLRECLEIEREKNAKLADTSEGVKLNLACSQLM